jgi:putative ABC transport system permease protein
VGSWRSTTEGGTVAVMGRFIQDLRFALRGFRRHPGLTVVTVLVLALGIGANTAIFSVVDALVLRPLPFPAPHQLVAVPHGLMYPDFLDLQKQARSFDSMAIYRPAQELVAAGGSEPEMATVVATSDGLMRVLRADPLIGRGFGPGDDLPGKRLALISHRLWQRAFGSDPGAVGRTVSLDGQSFTVIGVMAPAFRFPVDEEPADVWASAGSLYRSDRQWRGFKAYRSIARLAPGVELDRARAEVGLLAGRLSQLYPRESAGRTITLAPYDRTVRTGRTAFLIVLAAVGVVLLVACANVANLQLVRASARRRELAIRAALGAGRGPIIRQFLTESLLLAGIAGGLGLAAAVAGVDLLLAVLPDDVPRVHAVRLDGRALLYTVAAALGTALVVGLVPALQAMRTNLLDSLKVGERGTTGALGRLRAALLVAEVALAVVLLAGSGLLVRSFARVTAVDPGFRPQSLLVAQLKVNNPRPGFYDQLRLHLVGLPGVGGVTAVRELPYGRVFNSWNFTLDDRPEPPPGNPWWANARGVDQGYFATLRIAVREGRVFDAADLRGRPQVAVINEAFARKYWRDNRAALGHHVRAYERNVRIVGVVADTRGTCDQSGCAGGGAGRLDRAPEPEIYLPLSGVGMGYIAVRAVGRAPADLIGAVRAAVQALSPTAVLTEVRTMEQAIDQSLDHRRSVMFLLGAFAALAMVLAALGIYGVISHSVTQRTREIGVRMALGADAARVRAMVVMQGLRLCLVGLGGGVLAALALTRLLSSQLFGVSPSDPATYVALAAVILLVAVAASLVPALRATRVDPMVALRAD